jgi:RHS repeat-associated protein
MNSSFRRLRNYRVWRIACALWISSATCVCCLPAAAQAPYPQVQNQLAREPAVDFQTQAVIFSVPIVGTPFRFNYRSNAIGPKWRWSANHLYDVATETLSPGDAAPRYASALFAQPQTSPWFSGTEIAVAASDGSELYIFSNRGRHLRTLNTLTGAVLVRFDYGPAGVLTAIQDGYGNKTTIERDSSGLISAVVAPHGQRTTFNNDPGGDPIKITNPAGESVSLKYGGGQLNAVTDPRGNTYQFTLDSSGHVTKFEDPAHGIVSFSRGSSDNGFKVSWDTAATRTSGFTAKRAPNGEATVIASGAGGDETQIQTRPDGNTKLVFPDGMALMRVRQSDPRLGSQNSLLKALSALTPGGLTPVVSLSRTVEAVNSNGPANVTSLTDTITINGRKYTRSFDAKTRQITLRTPAGRKAVSTLNERGQVATVEVPGLAPLNLTYDSEGRWTGLTAGTGADARLVTATYDAEGWIVSVADALKRTVHFEHDSAGRITKRILPDGTAISAKYDSAGNLISVTPPGRPAHSFAYTPVNLISAYSPPAAGQVASDNATGLLNSIELFFIRLWNAIRFHVHQLLHASVTAQLEQDAAGTSYTYNNDGQLTKVTRPDRTVIDLSYGNAGRLNKMTGPGAALGLDHDPKTQNLASITTPDGALAYRYDGSLLTRAAWSGAIKGTVRFTYDNNLRPSSSSVNDAAPVALEYDADGLLTRVGKLTLEPDSASGFLIRTALGDVTTSQDYDGFGEISALRAAFKDRPLFAAQYGRDALGRIIRKTETVNGQTAVYTYVYDDAGRLADVTANGASSAHYTYGTNGNRIRVTRPSGTINASYDAQDRLTRYGNVVFKSTSNGEWSSKSLDGRTTSYSYDAFGNLKAVSLPNGTRIEYLVDGQNRRIGKKVNGNLAQGFLYQDQLRPAAELDGQGNLVSRFIYGTKINVPEYMEKGRNIYRIITDHLGSPRLVVDSSTGEIVQRMDYDEFGNVVNDTKPGFQPFGFAGGIYDPETKLTRFNARDYDAETGRWTAKDPMLFWGGDTDLFAYLRNDPLNTVDPTGLAPFGVTTVGVSGVVSYHVWAGTGGFGVVVGSQGETAVYVDVGGGVGVGKGLGWSAGTDVMFYPNSTVPTDLAGPFYYGSVGGGGGLGGSLNFTVDPNHPTTNGAGVSAGSALGITSFTGVTNTWVWQLPWWASIPTVYGDWLGDTRAADWWRCWTPFSDASGCASGTGDIHVQTFDGVRYDLQAAGEFLALKDRSGAVKMEMRLEPDASKRVSYATAVAAQVDGTKIAIHQKPQPRLYVGDKPVQLDPGSRMNLGKRGAIVSKGNSWVITWPDGTTATVNESSDHLDVLMRAGASAGTLVGLFGNADGKPEGDLVTRDGVALQGTGGFTRDDVYGRFADTWRIRQDESLFHYGAGESTATFTDRTVPRENVTVDSLDAAARAKAERACRAAGVTATAALNDCILDFAVTGDLSFLESARLAQMVARASDSSASPQNQGQSAGLPQGQSGIQLVLSPQSADLLWQWRVVNADRPDNVIQSQDAKHLAMSLPPSEYRVQTSALGSENQWVAWPQKIQVQPGNQAPIQIDSSLRLDVPPDLAKLIWSWRVVNSARPDQVIQRQDGNHRTVLLPPGQYQIETSAFGSENQWVVWPQKIEVQLGKQAPAQADSSLRLDVPADLAKLIWSWQVVSSARPGQAIQRQHAGHRLVMLPPGEYQIETSALGSENQWVVWPEKIRVEPGKQVPLQVDSSLRLDAPPDLAKTIWSWRVVNSARLDQVIQSQDGDHRTVLLPPGQYQIESSAFGSENQWVVWPQKIEVRSSGQVAAKLDSGIRLAGPGAGDNPQFQLLDGNGRTIQTWSGRTLEPFAPGRYALQARADSAGQWKRIANDVEIRAGSVTPVNVPALR